MLVIGLDIETTGIDLKKSRIIELALTVHELETGKKLASYEQRFNPRCAIEQKAFDVHGISMQDLVDSPLFEDEAPKIAKLLQKADVIVGHNGIGFDFPILTEELRRAKIAMPDVIEFDTMLAALWACEDGKRPRLAELAYACGYDYDTEHAHSALYDTELMMDCFFYARKNYNLFKLECEV